MRPPAFWQGEPTHPAARLLAPAAFLYGALGARRMDRLGQRAPCRVICLGNFTLGGAGKTPAARAIAEILRAHGASPVFLSRGYRGRLPGPLRVSPDMHGPKDVGDEPLLLARDAPAIVARDRVAGAALCRDEGATVIVMDDGLQNPSLAKDLAFAVVDAGAGHGNGLPFPAGPLRAPARRQWPHVAGVILIGEGHPGERVAAEAASRGLPVHRARLTPEGASFAGRRVLAFAGIGRPEKFFATLAGTGAVLAGTRPFPDHHPFRPADLEGLAREARRLGATLVTTEKDATRLPRGFAEVLPVRLAFENPEAVSAQVRGVLR
jgi:tetraacyldisaccharide 4'-kinase